MSLQLSPIEVDKDYCKKWNETMRDFVVLTRNGERVNNSLYRIGGIGSRPIGNNYFMLLKYVEDFYPKNIIKHTKSDPKHLSGRWCIIDKDGNEKVVFDSFKSPYLVKNSCIYTLEQRYYNIETGELYCQSFTSMESKEFLFLHNAYDANTSRRGVMKINKADGTFELFKD